MSTPVLKTRRPTGLPPHPMLLIAGVEKAGKSYSGAAFSASDLIDRTFWIEIGEGAADQYGAIPGARYEIVEHDGTYASIAASVEAATRQPRENGRPHAIVIDSITELWDLLSDSAQLKANARAAAKAAKANRPAPAEDVQITMDLWNDAKKKWRRVLELLRTYDGPVILLARLEMVAVMGADGKPTTDREWKIRAEKNLPYECDAIVKMTAPQQAALTGVRSTVLQVPPGRELPLPQFTIDDLLRRMGLDGQGATAPRSYTAPKPTLDEAPDAPMTRQPPRADDEWTAPATPPEATGQQLGNIADGLRIVRGIAEPAAMLAAVSQIIERPITAPEQLNRVEADRVLSVLRAEDEARRAGQQPMPDAAPASAAPVGTPDNPGITDAQQKMLHSLLRKAGYGDRAKGLVLIARYVGHPIESSSDLSKAEATTVIDKLSNGELPPPVADPQPGSDAMGEGISEFEALDQMILDVHDPQSLMDANDAIMAELQRGSITKSDYELLHERLDAHVERAKAGAAA